MHRLRAAASGFLIVAFILIGCSIPRSESPVIDSSRPIPILTDNPTSTPAVETELKDDLEIIPDFVCVLAPSDAIAAVEALGKSFVSEFTIHTRNKDDWIVVVVGEGNSPEEYWSIVGGRRNEQPERNFYLLTNYFSEHQPSGLRWIVGGNPVIHPDIALFQTVNWTGSMRANLLKALGVAHDCLS